MINESYRKFVNWAGARRTFVVSVSLLTNLTVAHAGIDSDVFRIESNTYWKSSTGSILIFREDKAPLPRPNQRYAFYMHEAGELHSGIYRVSKGEVILGYDKGVSAIYRPHMCKNTSFYDPIMRVSDGKIFHIEIELIRVREDGLCLAGFNDFEYSSKKYKRFSETFYKLPSFEEKDNNETLKNECVRWSIEMVKGTYEDALKCLELAPLIIREKKKSNESRQSELAKKKTPKFLRKYEYKY